MGYIARHVGVGMRREEEGLARELMSVEKRCCLSHMIKEESCTHVRLTRREGGLMMLGLV